MKATDKNGCFVCCKENGYDFIIVMQFRLASVSSYMRMCLRGWKEYSSENKKFPSLVDMRNLTFWALLRNTISLLCFFNSGVSLFFAVFMASATKARDAVNDSDDTASICSNTLSSFRCAQGKARYVAARKGEQHTSAPADIEMSERGRKNRSKTTVQVC